MLKKLKRALELASHTPNSIEILQGTQSGVWGLFGDMLVVSWVFARDKSEYTDAAKQDAQNIADQLSTLVQNIGLPNSTVTRYAIHQGKLGNHLATPLASQWRTLFAQAVIRLEHNEHESLKDLA